MNEYDRLILKFFTIIDFLREYGRLILADQAKKKSAETHALGKERESVEFDGPSDQVHL